MTVLCLSHYTAVIHLLSLSCSFLSLYSSHSPLLCPSMRETAIDEGTIFRPICFGVFFFIQPISFRRYFLQPSGPNLSFPPAHSKNIFMPEMIGELDKSGSLCILSCFFLTGGLERCIIQMSWTAQWTARYRGHTWAVGLAKCKIMWCIWHLADQGL